MPFQLYGNCDGQMLVFVVLVVTDLIVRFNVNIESQPAAFTNVSVYVPPDGRILPFQL